MLPSHTAASKKAMAAMSHANHTNSIIMMILGDVASVLNKHKDLRCLPPPLWRGIVGQLHGVCPRPDLALLIPGLGALWYNAPFSRDLFTDQELKQKRVTVQGISRSWL